MTTNAQRTIFWSTAMVIIIAGLAYLLARERRPADPALATLGDDPATIASRIDELGTETAVEIYNSWRLRLAEADSAQRPAILANMSKVAHVLAGRYLLPEYATDAESWSARSDSETRALAGRLVHLDRVFRDEEREAAAVRDTLVADLAWLRAMDDPFGVVLAESYLANNTRQRGRDEEAQEWARQYLADARQGSLHLALGDALCMLAMHGVATSEATVAPHLEEALAIALASRLAGLAGRVHAIAGIYAHEQGRYGQECDHFEAAVQVCRDMGQAARGLPYLVLLMQFYAACEDWDRVEALAPGADLLATESRALAAAGLGRDAIRVECDVLRLDELRARALLARGHVAEAQATYPALLAATRRLPFQDTAYVHDRRCGGLLDAGEPVAALAAVREALAFAEEGTLEKWTVRYRLHEARALLACGDTTAAAASLAMFDSASVGPEAWVDDLWPAACLVRAKVAVVHGGRPADILAAGLGQWIHGLGTGDASARAYLDLVRADGLRLALHDALSPDDRTGYGLELFWRQLPFWLGDSKAAPPASAAVLEGMVDDLARQAEGRLRAEGACHCLYARRGDLVLRWTASARGIVCDTLAVRGDMLATQVAGVLGLLAADPADAKAGPSADLAARLRDLAEDLLPAAVLQERSSAGHPPSAFYVSTVGNLALLPFAALNVGTPPRYEPLILHHDVATIRAGGRLEPVAINPASLVLAAPEVTPDLRRLYPGLTNLEGSVQEAERARSSLPDAELLIGPQVTREAVVARWEDVDCLYFAGHAVRSPESPYRTFLPLSAGPGDGLAGNAGQLDINDIRGADLGRVRLVVLSGCASGAPYVSGEATAPSLGDVFLDAGAAAAVQTLWRVRDDASPRLLADFLGARRQADRPLVTAFGASQRAASHDAAGEPLHPFSWAAYTLNLRAFE